MVYASTKATLKSEFGSSKIKEEIHGTTIDDVTLKGYHHYKKNINAPAPLTMREEELNEMRKTEIKTDYGTDSRQQTLSGLACGITDQAINAIYDMTKGKYNYLQFRIELKEEQIHLEKSTTIDIDKLPSQVPSDHARLVFLLFLFQLFELCVFYE